MSSLCRQQFTRKRIKDLKDQLGEMHQSIDGLSSSVAGSQSAGGGLKCLFLIWLHLNAEEGCRTLISENAFLLMRF